MDVTVENAAGLRHIEVTSCASAFSNGHLTFVKQLIAQPPIVKVITSRPIGSTAISKVIGQEQYIGLSIIPEIQGGDILSEIVFLADCSGSMTGEPIQSVRETLRFLTRQLPSSCYFQIIFFSSCYRSVFNEAVPVSDASLATVSASLAELMADGGTQLYTPLQAVYRTPPRPGYVRQIFILTDGQVEREADILSLVAKNRGSQRIFSLGIGDQVARAFIEELATRSTGHAVFVNPTNIQVAATEQLKSALQPSVTSPQIEVSDAVVEIAPFPIPPLFSNAISNVYICTKTTENVQILVTGASKSLPFEAVVAARHSTGKIELLKFHAFFNIKDLQDKIPLASPSDAKRLKASIITLSQQSGIISDFTALYTVLEGAELHFKASLGQERFASIQPFTQGQCRGQERFQSIARPTQQRGGFSEFYRAPEPVPSFQNQQMPHTTHTGPEEANARLRIPQKSSSARGLLAFAFRMGIPVVVLLIVALIFFLARLF
jgi:uncharacterized protein YegL